MSTFKVYGDSIQEHLGQIKEIDGRDSIRTYQAFEGIFCMIADAEVIKDALRRWLPKTATQSFEKEWKEQQEAMNE